jgi:serine/threonine protein kinase
MTDCPSLQTLQNMLDDCLPDEEWLTVESHVEECPDCRAALDQLTSTAKASFLPLPLEDAAPCFDFAQAEIRYRVVRFHARGGLGQVLVARDEQFQRDVALKILSGQDNVNRDRTRRFLAEAQITAQLEHPGIVPVHALARVGEEWPCYVMRFVEGETLEEAVQRYHLPDPSGPKPAAKRPTLRELLGRFVAVCNTVAYTHSRHVLHRDLKPANIMLGPFGETLVLDWGLAKSFAQPESSGEDSPASQAGTRTGTLMSVSAGTPGFMSPEQQAGEGTEVGPASDIYNLGATLYYLLTGRPALRLPGRPTQPTSPEKILPEDFPPPRKIKPGVHTDLEAVCLRALARRPEDRYGSAIALAADIEHWLADEPVSARPEPWREHFRRYVKRHRVLAAGVAATILVALISMMLSTGFLRAAYTREFQARELAEEQRGRASASLQSALNVMDYFLEGARRPPRSQLDHLQELRTYSLPRLIVFYNEILERQDHQDPTARSRLGRAYHGLGACQALLANRAEAEACFLKARAIQEQLEAEARDPQERAPYVSELAVTLFELVQLYRAWGKSEAAAEARHRIEELHQTFPDRANAYQFALHVAQKFQQQGQYEEVPVWLSKVVDGLEAVPAEQRDADFPHLLGGHLHVRALTYYQLGRYALACKDWDRRAQLDARPLDLDTRMMRGVCLARIGDHVQAVAEAEALARVPKVSGQRLFDLACLVVVAASAADQDSRLQTGERMGLVDRYLARALGWLARCRDLGFFQNPGGLEELQKDPDLAILRSRTDFTKFVATVEKKSRPPAKQ